MFNFLSTQIPHSDLLKTDDLEVKTPVLKRPLTEPHRTTLRNRMAAHFANTLLERVDIPEASPVWAEEIAENAVELADALIGRLER